jgi:hypothetical protein
MLHHVGASSKTVPLPLHYLEVAPKSDHPDQNSNVIGQSGHIPRACSNSFDNMRPFLEYPPTMSSWCSLQTNSGTSAIFGSPTKIDVESVLAPKQCRCLCNIWKSHQNSGQGGASSKTIAVLLQYLEVPPKFMLSRCLLRNSDWTK